MTNKKELLIDCALHLFYQHGINSVGINEVLKSSGVAKKTLYNHFESKEALILATLKQRDTKFCAWLNSKIETAKNDRDVIEKLFNGLTCWFHSNEIALGEFRGCFFVNSSAEFSDTTCAIAHYCKHHKMNVREIIQNALKDKSKALLDTICLLKEGAIVAAYVEQDFLSAQKCISPLITIIENNKNSYDEKTP